MSNSKFYTDGTNIFEIQQAIVILEDLKTGKTVEVECQEGGKLEGFEPIELPAPAGKKSKLRFNAGRPRKSPPPDNSASSNVTGKPPRAASTGKSSKYKGVSLDKKTGKWKVQVYLGSDKGIKWGGLFADEKEAARRVDEMLVEAGLPKRNFP